MYYANVLVEMSSSCVCVYVLLYTLNDTGTCKSLRHNSDMLAYVHNTDEKSHADSM